MVMHGGAVHPARVWEARHFILGESMCCICVWSVVCVLCVSFSGLVCAGGWCFSSGWILVFHGSGPSGGFLVPDQNCAVQWYPTTFVPRQICF